MTMWKCSLLTHSENVWADVAHRTAEGSLLTIGAVDVGGAGDVESRGVWIPRRTVIHDRQTLRYVPSHLFAWVATMWGALHKAAEVVNGIAAVHRERRFAVVCYERKEHKKVRCRVVVL